MKSKPETNKASTAPTVKALNEESQSINKGTIEMNSTVVPANSQPVFNFGDNQVRLVVRDGEPWFVANDVCVALGYANTSKAIGDHLDDDERSTITNSESRNGGGQLVIINESGLYALVLRSRKPEARKFAKWVTREVLPSIRKTGEFHQPVAANPAIDYTRISPAQAQDLREITQAIVEAKIQGHAETWSRFQRKFRVNSYLELPASRHEDARQYLIAKLPNGYVGEAVEPFAQITMEQIEHAMAGANALATQVQQAALIEMLKAGSAKYTRWTVSFDYSEAGPKPYVARIEDEALVGTLPQMAKIIQDPGAALGSAELMDLAKACMNRLASRIGTSRQPALV